jgi:hypothetical protein
MSFEKYLNDPNQTTNYYLTVTPDSRMLLVMGRFGWNGVFWDLKTNSETAFAPLQRPPLNTQSPRLVQFSADGRYGAGASANVITVWSAKTGVDIGAIPSKFTNYLTIVPEASAVVASGTDKGGWVSAWSYNTGKELWNDRSTAFTTRLAAIPKSKRIAFGTLNELVIHDCIKGDDIVRWKAPGTASHLTASHDGKHLATFGEGERKVHLWATPGTATKKP